jgi:DNA-binding FrmR family transcriptional regulator
VPTKARKNTSLDTISDHTSELKKFKRVKGQIEGVEKMIEDQRYCTAILSQLRAIRAGLLAIESSILKTHLHTCVSEAIRSGKSSQANKKINEVVEVFKWSGSKGVSV